MPNRLSKFWQELKRRKVIKAVTMYAATAFIIMEAADIMLPRLGLPDWTVTLVIILLIIGFPAFIILSWTFDITPDGIKKTESVDTISDQPLSSKKRRGLQLSDVVITVLIIVVCILLYPKLFNSDRFHDLRDVDGRISVAVMPFENHTGDSALYAWENGISTYLTNGLGNSQELAVINSQALTEMLSSRGELSIVSLSPSLARETARRISANMHIRGSYIGSERNCTLTADLVNTSSGEIIWTTRVKGDLGSNYSLLLDRLADTIKNYLEIKALEENANVDLLHAFPNSSVAYRYYVEGLNALARHDNHVAVGLLLKAYEIDTTFAFAAFYISLAMNYGREGRWDEQLKWAERAYELKDRLPVEYQGWIDLWYSGFSGKGGSEILRCISILEKSDWESRFMWFEVGYTLTNQFRDYKRSIPAFEKIEEINNKWGNDWIFDWYYSLYTLALLMEERLSDAERIINAWLRVNPDDFWIQVSKGALSLLRNDSAAFERHSYELRKKLDERGIGESRAQSIFGEMYCAAKDSLAAAGCFRKAWEMEPDIAGSLIKLIEAQLQCNINLEECLELSETGIERFPLYRRFYWTKGTALYKLERYEEAVKFLKQAESLYRGFYLKRLDDDIKAVEKALALQEQQ